MNPTAPVETQPPWEAISAEAQSEARQRQAALVPALERWHNPLVTHEELESGAVATYERITGSRIDVRTVRRWIRDVLDRDNGRRDFSRPDLFLRRNPPLRPQHRAELTQAEQPFAPLFDLMESIPPGLSPTKRQEASLWLTAWEIYVKETAFGKAPKRAKAELLHFLERHSHWLSESGHRALQERVRRKFLEFEQAANEGMNPAAVSIDGRARRLGQKIATSFKQEHLDFITYKAGKLRGRVSQALDEIIEQAEQLDLPGDLVALALQCKGQGSYVNRRLLEAVRPDIKSFQSFLHGGQSVDDITPALTRVYNRVRPMTAISADDTTLNVKFSVPDGNGWHMLTRGQLLLFLDVSSRRIITYALIPEKSYDGLQIATTMRKLCSEWGIPSLWDFEQNIWKRSKIVKSVSPIGWDVPDRIEQDTGWELLGSKIRHARRARTKTAELVIGLLQNLMDGCKGFTGRNEREDIPETTRKAELLFSTEHFKRDVLAGRRQLDQDFYTFDQWDEVLHEFIKRYNAKPQGGRLGGKSPDQAWAEKFPHDDPPIEFNAAAAFLCAPFSRRLKVKDQGILFNIGRQKFHYVDESIAELRHREVICRFDPQFPEVVLVTEPGDVDGKSARFVSRLDPVDYYATLDPESVEADHYRRQVAKVNGFMSHAGARFRHLVASFEPKKRPVFVSKKMAKMGRELLEKREAAMVQSSQNSQRQNRSAKLARSIGVSTATVDLESPETEQALRRRVARREALENEQAAEPESEKT